MSNNLKPEKSIEEIQKASNLINLQKFSYNEIEGFTNNFSTIIKTSGFAKVYKGTIGPVKVAVKEFLKLEPKYFFKELEKISKGVHPIIVHVYGYCHEKKSCIIMEYMKKGTLQDIINQKPDCANLNKKETIRMLRVLSDALCDMHRRNFYHLDIKPSNILFDEYEKPKFSDFMLNDFYENSDPGYRFARNGTLVQYVDPFSMARSTADYFTDVYSFGLVVLAILTKRKNPVFLFRDAEEIYLAKDFDKLRHYYDEDWGNEINMKLMNCAMDCISGSVRERNEAIKISANLREIEKLLG